MGWKTAWRLIEKPLVHVALIAALGLLVYSNTFDVPFQFDDKGNIVDNPAIKDFKYFRDTSGVENLGLGNVAHTFKTRYVGYLSFALNYKLGGLDVRGYHAFNLAVHILNALLVYWLVRLTLRAPFFVKRSGISNSTTALIASLLFVAHPVQTQAVTYIVQRFASLAATFYLLSIVFYAKARLSSAPLFSKEGKGEILLTKSPPVPLFQRGITNLKSPAFLVLSVVSAVLAMKTKENAFTLPLMAAVYEFMFFDDGLRKRALYLAPIALTLPMIPLALAGVAERAGGIGGALGSISASEMVKRSAGEYLFTEFRVVVTYIRLLLLPVNQNLDYGYPIYKSFLAPQVFLSSVLLLSLLGLALYLLHRSKAGDPRLRLASLGVFWFFLALSVESGAVPIADVIYEHRAYLPSAGAFISLAAVLSMATNRSASARKLLIAALAAMVLAFSCAAYARNGVWGSAVGLWEDVVAKSPNKTRAHYNLGVAYFGRGLMEESIKHYEVALGLDPGDAKVHTNIANAYWRTGEKDKAVLHFKEAARLAPKDPAAYVNLGSAYAEAGQKERAVEQFKRALELDPTNVAAHYNLGSLFKEMGMSDWARKHLEVAARLNLALAVSGGAAVAGEAGAQTARGAAEEANRQGLDSFSAGRMEEAIGHFNRALELRPGYVEARFNLGAAYQNTGMFDRAIEHYLKGLAIRPDDPLAHNNLGLAYMGRRSLDNAVKHLQAAARLRPDYSEAHYNLGLAYMASDRLAEAKKALEAALRLNPASAGAHFNLGLLYMKENNTEAARREFEAALKIDPGMAQARRFLDFVNRQSR